MSGERIWSPGQPIFHRQPRKRNIHELLSMRGGWVGQGNQAARHAQRWAASQSRAPSRGAPPARREASLEGLERLLTKADARRTSARDGAWKIALDPVARTVSVTFGKEQLFRAEYVTSRRSSMQMSHWKTVVARGIFESAIAPMTVLANAWVLRTLQGASAFPEVQPAYRDSSFVAPSLSPSVVVAAPPPPGVLPLRGVQVNYALYKYFANEALRAPSLPPKLRDVSVQFSARAVTDKKLFEYLKSGNKWNNRLYRGLSVPRARLPALLGGAGVEDGGFTSWSRVRTVALGFAGGDRDWPADKVGVMLELRLEDVPPGVPWLWFEGDTTTAAKTRETLGREERAYEEETVLPPGTFRYTSGGRERQFTWIDGRPFTLIDVSVSFAPNKAVESIYKDSRGRGVSLYRATTARNETPHDWTSL